MRRSRILALAVACVAVLAACGSGAGDKAAPARLDTKAVSAVRDAAQTTTDAKTARIALTVGTSGGSGTSFNLTASGVTDYANHTADITLDLGDLAKQLPSGLLGSGDLAIEERVVDNVIYMKLPSALTSLTGGSAKPWTKVDGSKILGDSTLTGETDPTQALAYLGGVSDDVKQVGTDTIRGVATTHYAATLDLKKALGQLPSSLKDNPEYSKLINQTISKLGASTFPADVWIDGQGRLAKISYALTVPAAGQKVAVNYSMELYDFGTAVDVQAPPADQVGDAPLGLLGGATGGASVAAPSTAA